MSKVHARLRRAALVTAVATLAPATLASPAGAAVTDLGTGQGARLAVSDDGKAHVAWAVNPSGSVSGSITYCRVPASGGACEVVRPLSFPNPHSEDVQASGPASVFVQGSTVTVFSSCYFCGPGTSASTDRMLKWVSTDGGTTWPTASTPIEVHRGGVQGDTGQSLLLGSGSSSIFVFANPARVRAGTEPTVFDNADALSDIGYDYDASIAAVPGGKKLVTARNNLSDAQFNVFTDPDGDPIAADEIETFANWTPFQNLTGTGGGAWTSLAGGVTNPVLVYSENTNSIVNQMMSRRFDPATNSFLAPVAISTPQSQIFDGGSSQTPAGRTDVVWEQNSPFRLLYSASPDGGATWTAPRRLRTGRAIASEVAANTAGSGFAISNTDPGTGTISIVPLSDAGPDVDPTPTPTPTPVATPVATPTPTPTPTPGGTTYRPGGPSGVPSTGSGSSNGGTYTVTGPKTCVPRGGKFSVTLKVKKQKKKGNLFVKVTKVDFSINGKIKKTDKKAPFKQTLTATATAAKGSTITMRARAFIKVRKTKKVPKKSVSLKIRICS